MKKAIKKEAVQFNARYADIEAGCKLVKEELLKNLSYVRKLSKQAQSLYKYGNKKCYAGVRDENGVERNIKPIDGVKDLGVKMDLLNWLCGGADELKDLAGSFDWKIK